MAQPWPGAPVEWARRSAVIPRHHWEHWGGKMPEYWEEPAVLPSMQPCKAYREEKEYSKIENKRV